MYLATVKLILDRRFITCINKMNERLGPLMIILAINVSLTFMIDYTLEVFSSNAVPDIG